MKILIAGIGGVGGFFGGLLAKRFEQHPDISVYFLARGEHLVKIREEGLKVVWNGDVWTAYPAMVTDDPNELGEMDWVVFCTKGYDLEETARRLAPCITADTIVLPLLNGVDAATRIRAIHPDADVIEGCVYIMARLNKPGIVENGGNIQQLYFGRPGAIDARLMQFERLCKDAGIEATLTDRIREVTWEKFIFISPLATTTSRYNMSIGKVREEHGGELYQLIHEVHDLAVAKGIDLSNDIIEKTIQKINGLKYEHTSSMHSDYLKGNGRTEVDSLTGYVVRESAKLGLEAKQYQEMYLALTGFTHYP